VSSPHGVVARVGHVDSAQRVYGDSAGAVELRGRSRAVDEPRRTVAGDRRHVAAGVDPAHGVIARVGDVDIARAVNRHALRVVEPGGRPLIVKEVRKA